MGVFTAIFVLIAAVLITFLVLKVTRGWAPKKLSLFLVVGAFAFELLGGFIGGLVGSNAVFAIFGFISGAALCLMFFLELIGNLDELKNVGSEFSQLQGQERQQPPQ